MSMPLACVRCRAKKIRCDSQMPSCSACQRGNYECMIADLITNKQYERGYVQSLEMKVASLERILREGSRPPGSDTVIQNVHQGDNPDNSVVCMDDSPVRDRNEEGVEPENLSKFLGDAGGKQLASLIIGTMQQITRQFDVRRSSTSPQQTNQVRMVEVTSCEPTDLPSRTTADRLLKSYLRGPHIVHPFQQVSEIALILDRVYTSPKPMAIDLFMLSMTFAIGRVFTQCVEEEPRSVVGYYSAAMVHARDVLQLQGVKAIQCILLVLLFRIYHHSPGPSVWDLSRLAIRICIEEGLHLEPQSTTAMAPMELQMRRRIFWDCYVLDRRSSQMLGWPFAIQDEDIEAELPYDMEDHELIMLSEDPMLLSSPDAGIRRGGPSSISPFLHLVRLRQITSQARQVQRLLSTDATSTITHLQKLHKSLDEWRTRAPVYQSPRSIYQRIEWFNLTYHMEVLAAFRPFLGRDRPEITAHCLESSLGVIFAYASIFNSKHSLYTGVYVYALYTAGLCCVFCIMSSSAGTFDPEHVKEGINLCQQTLKDIAARWPAIARHAESIEILGKEVVKALDERSEQFWKEVEEATMIGFNESILNSYSASPTPLMAAWTDGGGMYDHVDLVSSGFGAFDPSLYADLFANEALGLTTGGGTM